VFNKVLIANRGEIALRVIRACHELGISTVAVYSEADRDALHVRFADEAVCIGPPPAPESYLNISRIISAAEITNADAIHPGYGFHAESPQFAEICQACNIKYIGPPAKVIYRMGDKAEAKRQMKLANVPTIPGSEGAVPTQEEARKICRDIGFPVIFKAVSGGGGRGMRVVESEKEIQRAFESASAEALAGFGNAELYIEKYLVNPRHIEMQIFADEHGNVVHLGERDCSVQRRHQKLIEESPSPAFTPEMRHVVGDAAVRGASQVGYTNAGTIEFLLDDDNNWYFMEMNTRIQVEHTVTEMVTGLDLIKEQISVAAGQELSFKDEIVEPRGHAIECRINAEDPAHNYRPSAGQITNLHFPGGLGIRIDSHIYAEYRVPPYYDSLLAKVICHGKDRGEAINRMERTLEELIVEGVHTTIPAHQQILKNQTFISGKVRTGFLEEEF
jgi:acetyl-CoA carboxylase, biotin carboxylase subunit